MVSAIAVDSTSCLNYSLIVIQSYCMASEDLLWTIFILLLCPFWSLKASVLIHCNCMQQSLQIVVCVPQKREIHMVENGTKVRTRWQDFTILWIPIQIIRWHSVCWLNLKSRTELNFTDILNWVLNGAQAHCLRISVRVFCSQTRERSIIKQRFHWPSFICWKAQCM